MLRGLFLKLSLLYAPKGLNTTRRHKGNVEYSQILICYMGI